jgi:hypothetical protein
MRRLWRDRFTLAVLSQALSSRARSQPTRLLLQTWLTTPLPAGADQSSVAEKIVNGCTHKLLTIMFAAGQAKKRGEGTGHCWRTSDRYRRVLHCKTGSPLRMCSTAVTS